MAEIPPWAGRPAPRCYLAEVQACDAVAARYGLDDTGPVGEWAQSALTAATTLVRESFASPNSSAVFGS